MAAMLFKEEMIWKYIFLAHCMQHIKGTAHLKQH